MFLNDRQQAVYAERHLRGQLDRPHRKVGSSGMKYRADYNG